MQRLGLFHQILCLQAILGKIVSRPAVLDAELVEELVSISEPDDHFRVVQGTTMCTQDFYEGQSEQLKILSLP